MFENRVLTKMFGPKRDEVRGGEEDCIMNFTSQQIQFGLSIKNNEMDRTCGTYGGKER
jgi:hypothetical protein